MTTCKCNETLGNTGAGGCQPIAKVTKKLILVPLYDSTGAANKITVGTQLTDAIVSALINQADDTKRWYPLPYLENVTNTRADSTFETAPSGVKAFIKQGIRNFSGEIWNQASEYKAQLDKVRCKGAGVYLIDSDGSIRGMVTEDSSAYLYPIKIDKQSWDVREIEATDTTLHKLMVSFDFDQKENDALLRMISASSMNADLDLLSIDGLVDVTGTNIATSQTSLIMKLVAKNSGDIANQIFVSGLVAADFTLYNETDTTSVTIISATANPSTKSYTITYASQTVSDVLTLSVSKNGYDFTQVATVVNTVV